MKYSAKPQMPNSCAQFISDHPTHIETNVPLFIARRICTIISKQNIGVPTLLELKSIPIDRPYPLIRIEYGINVLHIWA